MCHYLESALDTLKLGERVFLILKAGKDTVIKSWECVFAPEGCH